MNKGKREGLENLREVKRLAFLNQNDNYQMKSLLIRTILHLSWLRVNPESIWWNTNNKFSESLVKLNTNLKDEGQTGFYHARPLEPPMFST